MQKKKRSRGKKYKRMRRKEGKWISNRFGVVCTLWSLLGRPFPLLAGAVSSVDARRRKAAMPKSEMRPQIL